MIQSEHDISLAVSRFVSEKRFIHCKNVAQTCEFLISHYKCKNFTKRYKNISGTFFCGMIHDMAREFSDEELIKFCNKENIILDEECYRYPVLSHGFVSAFLANELLPSYPETWAEAVRYHTTGKAGLDELGLALFIADYTEPGRTFLSQEDRKIIYSNPTITACALDVLNRMIQHTYDSRKYELSQKSLEFKLYLEGM